jgi:hypothetical protein
MAEGARREHSSSDPDPEIAAAELLFRDESGAKPKQPPGSIVAPGSAVNEVFDLAEGPISEDLPQLRPIGPPRGADATGTSRSARAGHTRETHDQSRLDPSELVEEVWSRTSEWGGTLIVVLGWLAILFSVVYFTLGWEHFGLAFLTLILGGIAAVILSYPILITLERPVRITPEQALRDYYGALSHHFPHFRRMWLLLSSAGRISTAYGSFEGFKAYWKDQIAQLRQGHAGSLTPLVFEVADFRADKSAGKVKIDAAFALKVWVRGRRREGTIHSVPMALALVRGPDNMWYLEDGTLGRDRRTAGSVASPE